MSWLFPSVIATMIGTILLSSTYFYLYLLDRKKYLGIWTISWTVYISRFIFMLFLIKGYKSHVFLIGNQVATLVSGIILLWGTYCYIDKKFPKVWLYLCGINIGWIVISILHNFPFLYISLPTFSFLALIYISTGILFLKSGRHEKKERTIVGSAFILWGLHKADYPFLRPVEWLAPWGYLLGAMLEFTVALGMLMIYFQKTRNELKNNEEKYRRFTENAKDMIYRMSLPDGKYEYVSPASDTIFGFPPETWYQNPILIQEIIHPNYHGYFKEKWALLLKGELDPSYEYQILYKGNETRWIHQRNVGVWDDKGRLVAIEGIVTDITELKHSEKALQDSHKRFFTVLNSIDATVYVVDMQTHKILFMNQYMIDSFGRDMTGEICWDAYRGQSSQCAHCPNAKLVDKDGNPKGVHVWQTQNPKTKKWYINYDRAIEWTDGRIVKLQIASDITELKRMEEELRQAHKMESIGTISGGIAHDFNNILGIIIGNTELAIDDIPQWSPAYNNLQEIKTAGMRAKDIVNQLLSFSRKSEQTKKNIRILPIIKESIKLVRSSIPATIDIKMNAGDIQGIINADPTQIHQILINLCTNAAHAMDEDGGTLTIHLSEIELDDPTPLEFQDIGPGKYVQLTITDTGTGIEDSIIDKIFDPYFTTKEVGKGSGMGLAVVHGIVKSYNGSINVYSEPLKGTTFKILFPSADEASFKEEKSPDINLAGSEKILFIDDEEALAKMGAEMLKRMGYDVVYHTSSIHALDLIKNEPDKFDLVITDMTMPGLTGDQLTKKILEINPDMPVILCTGFSHKIDSGASHEMGIRKYVEKPLNRKQLAAAVRKVLSNSKDKTN